MVGRLTFFRGEPSATAEPIFAYRLRPSRTRVGRTDDNDVVLPDDAVSRSHCILDVRDDAVELVDRSSNGTWVNGTRTRRATLRDGDVVRVGPFHARVDLHPQEAFPPTEEAQPEARHEELVDSAEGLAVAEAFLTIVEGPDEGKRLRLRGARFSIGGPGSRIVLPDPTLVKDHVRVRLNQGRVLVEPAAGAAFVGPARVRDLLPLFTGEELRLGNTVVRVDWDVAVDTPQADKFGDMVGKSDAMRSAFGLLRRMAAHHAPVLLIGESGTGKELAARGLHDASPRAATRFVAVNCGAITPTLFESELFGHEKGSFTGATERRDGAFQRADGGTLFLDEVGELPEEAQAKLLRVLETGEVRRVGSTEPTFPDVRIVAATNRLLHEAARDGDFRSDLYFRLAVLAVRLPPLRERPDDIPAMATAIAARIHPQMHVTPEAMAALQGYHWPGNARELRNVLTRAFVLYGPLVEPASLIFSPLEAEGANNAPRRSIEEAEREVVADALRRARDNRTVAARLLGIPRSSLLYKLKRWGME
jgi:transcriptional regulator with AAA-type ATPase domain/pSer/pThr/pTyr-binding forkhead associated (FHA) protein